MIATKPVSSRQTHSALGGKERLRKQTPAQPSALRHRQPTARKVEREFTTYQKSIRKHVLVDCTSNYSALLELLSQLPPPRIRQANLKLFILRRIFRRNTVCFITCTHSDGNISYFPVIRCIPLLSAYCC